MDRKRRGLVVLGTLVFAVNVREVNEKWRVHQNVNNESE